MWGKTPNNRPQFRDGPARGKRMTQCCHQGADVRETWVPGWLHLSLPHAWHVGSPP